MKFVLVATVSALLSISFSLWMVFVFGDLVPFSWGWRFCSGLFCKILFSKSDATIAEELSVFDSRVVGLMHRRLACEHMFGRFVVIAMCCGLCFLMCQRNSFSRLLILAAACAFALRFV